MFGFDSDDWLLQIECFDPHEPFHAPERFRKLYETDYVGGVLNWPNYEKVTESAEEVAEIRANYAALVTMCDHYFGQLLDYFDEHDMWEDTALILTTDHGFLLSEHDWWAKNLQPYYEEISHIPLIIHHPGHADRAGERCDALTQTFDLMPTILDIFGVDVPQEVQGASLLSLIADGKSGRDIGVFGMFGGPVGATDGRYTLYLYPGDIYQERLHEYTLMPTHLNEMFSMSELETTKLSEPFDFTKRLPVLKISATREAKRIPTADGRKFGDVGTVLYDLSADPKQEHPIDDPAVMARLTGGIINVFRAHDAPAEIYDHFGLELQPAAVSHIR